MRHILRRFRLVALSLLLVGGSLAAITARSAHAETYYGPGYDPSGCIGAQNMARVAANAGFSTTNRVVYHSANGDFYASSAAIAVAITGRESGWCTTAYNSSGATGLWQILQPMHSSSISRADSARSWPSTQWAFNNSGGGTNFRPWDKYGCGGQATMSQARIDAAIQAVATMPGTGPTNTLISGRVTINGAGVDGVTINICNVATVKTGFGGYFMASARVGTQYCVRIVDGMPGGVPGPATANNPDVGGALVGSYEYQLAGANCYHVAFCGDIWYKWDRNSDAGNNFVFAGYRAVGSNGVKGYRMDTFGGLHQFGSAGTATGGGYNFGQNIYRAVGFELGRTRGYELDGFGGLHPFAGSGETLPPRATGAAYWPGWDIARDVAMNGVGDQGYVLDGLGPLHPFNGAPAVTAGGAKFAFDIAKKVVTLPLRNQALVLDGFGGIHRVAMGGAPLPPRPTGASYWSGWDIARSMVVAPDGRGGYVLDGFGGIHPFGLYGSAPPALKGGGYWPGWDIARDLVITDWNNFTGYQLDGMGGMHPIHP